MCPDERFAAQPANADCSATLIAPDIMLTAGHCINSCGDSRFVFDYYVTAGGTLPPIYTGRRLCLLELSRLFPVRDRPRLRRSCDSPGRLSAASPRRFARRVRPCPSGRR